MWKNLASLVVAAGIIAGGIFLYKNRHRLFRPDFNSSGGTLLVFEVDGEPPTDGLDGLVSALSRRFDPQGATGIIVRADGKRQVEIGVPFGKQHDDQVEMVKRLVARVGVLRFRILANLVDDEAAVAAARMPGKEAKLNAPPGPLRSDKGETDFPVKIPGSPPHRYRWVELDEGAVKSLYLDPTGLTHTNPADQANVTESCRTGLPFSPTSLQHGLVQARKLAGASDPVFYVLLREPAVGEDVPADAFESVRTNTSRGRGIVLFRLNQQAGNRFYELTRQNVSTYTGPMLQRHLAFVLDGKVIALPALHSAMRRDGQISGDFSPSEAQDLANLLRGGALPCRLKPEPVRETTTGKK